jgi:hypothetical protein
MVLLLFMLLVDLVQKQWRKYSILRGNITDAAIYVAYFDALSYWSKVIVAMYKLVKVLTRSSRVQNNSWPIAAHI